MRCLIALISFLISTTALGSLGSDHVEAALRQFHDATKRHRSGQHLLNLSALRNLKDPALRPFFFQFTEHADWAVQVHAVLGIAELSETQTVDPWLVQQVAPSAREHLIAQALDDGLLLQEQMEALLQWPLLEATPRVLLLAELRSLGISIDQDMLKELANITDLSVALFAALLTEDETNIKNATRLLRHATQTDRDNALRRTLQLIRQYAVYEASPWLCNLLEDDAIALNEKERYWTLYSLLSVDKVKGLEYWDRNFPTVPDRKHQVHFLLILLESGIQPTEGMLLRLAVDVDDPLLGLMARAGNINKPQSEITNTDIQALIDLVELGHRDSTDWAFRVTKTHLPDELAKVFYEKISIIPERSSAKRNGNAIHAFLELIHIAPDTAWKLLREVKDDSEQQELLLYATLQNSEEDAIEKATLEAAKLRRIGVSNPDVMTLLLIARGSSPLQEADQRNLGIIAAGGGNVTPAMKTQAAWLYLKRMGLADKALAAVRSQ